MQESSHKPVAGGDARNSEFLRQRLDAMTEGLKEGIRREVARREKLGLPIYVAENGTVVNRQGTTTSLDGVAI